MKKTRPLLEIFSLSFLDIIACGFGAVILLVLLSKNSIDGSKPVQSPYPNAEETAQLLQELSQAQASKNRSIAQQQNIVQTLSQQQTQQQTLKQLHDYTQQKLASLQQEYAEQKHMIAQLQQQSATLKAPKKQERDKEVGGIPVESDYIIFIIDTSGSMTQYATKLQEQINNILSVHPVVKGFQVMNDNGIFMVQSTKGQWINDTPTRRKRILSSLAHFKERSNSSPVEGLETALTTYATPTRKLSIYIFGDDFSTQVSYDNVLKTLNTLNRHPQTGEPMASIHSIGFGSSERYSTLMREVTRQNRGTFLGLP